MPRDSLRLYRWLLMAYPSDFRREYGAEMIQVFGDLRQDAQTDGRVGLIALWARVAADTVITATLQRSYQMTRKLTSSTLAAAVLLLPTLIFLLIMFTRFVLGLEGPYNAWERFYMNPGLSALNWALERFMVLAPFGALALAALPITHLQVGREDGALVASVSVKVSSVTIGVILVALLMIAAIMGYGFVENFKPV